jgi:2,3-bisphosphoglycerate-dependent phosphoglycerate mutase
VADPRHAAFLRMLDELHARHLIGVDDVRELWLVRHADAYMGMQALGDGRIDPPLSSRGLEQARLLAGRLAPIRFDAVWASDLLRAWQTAEEIARDRSLTVRVDTRLREVRTNWDEGGSEALNDPGVYPFPEAEAEVVERMTAALAEVTAELPAGPPQPPRAAIVTHNAAIGIYVSSVLGLRWGQLRVMPQFTSVSVLAVKDERVVVQSFADATHLAAGLQE